MEAQKCNNVGVATWLSSESHSTLFVIIKSHRQLRLLMNLLTQLSRRSTTYAFITLIGTLLIKIFLKSQTYEQLL